MSFNTIQYRDSLPFIWTILIYEAARLAHDKDASDLARPARALVERWKGVTLGQRDFWAAEIDAQAGVDAGSSGLEDVITAIDKEMLRLVPDREAPRRKRYFKKTRSEITRLGLESAIEYVREWPESLKSEPEPSLQALGAQLAEQIASGDTLVRARAVALAKTSDHRVREIVRFVDELNAERRVRYGLLIQRAHERGLPTDWPDRFFKKTAAAQRKAKPSETAITPTA